MTHLSADTLQYRVQKDTEKQAITLKTTLHSQEWEANDN